MLPLAPKPATIGLAIALTATALGGALAGGDATLRDPAQAIQGTSGHVQAEDDLTREDLLTGRITFTTEVGGWRALLIEITPALWDLSDWGDEGGRAELELLVATDTSPSAGPYIQYGVYTGDQPIPLLATLALPGGEPATRVLSIGYICSLNCPEEPPVHDLSILFGDANAASTVHIGIPGPATPQDPSAALADLLDRPALDIAPPYAGQGGIAGTYTHAAHADGTETTTVAGAIEVDRDVREEQGPASLERRLAVDVDHTIPGAGTATMDVHVVEDTGVRTWNLTAQIPPYRLEREGAHVDVPEHVLEDPVPQREGAGYQPSASMMVQPDAGQVVLDLDQVFTGTTGEGIEHHVTWGWTSADYTELHGWPHHDAYGAPGLDPDDTPTRLAACEPETGACWTPVRAR